MGVDKPQVPRESHGVNDKKGPVIKMAALAGSWCLCPWLLRALGFH